MNPAISFHETILSHTTLPPNEWSGGADYRHFLHQDSLHTYTKGYGRPMARYACWCKGPVRSSFSVAQVINEPDRKSRYLLKVVAAWVDWKKGVHPVQILVNGVAIYDAPFFLENVLVGWPAQYFELPPDILREGSNEIEIISGAGEENTLLLAEASILHRSDLVDFTVYSSPEAVAAGEDFWVQLHLFNVQVDIDVQVPSGQVEFLGRKGDLFRFRALTPGENTVIRFTSEARSCEAIVDRVGPAHLPGRIPVQIGMDGDDVRTDRAGEMDRALAHFIFSRVGNFMGFRTGFGRNACRELRALREHWQRWIELCKDRGVSVYYSGPEECLDGFDFVAEAGEYFAGYQFHEPYLVFQPRCAEMFMTDQIRSAKNFQEKKEAYVEYLRGRAASERKGDVAVYSGEPSMTCIYSAEAGVDALLCEPVSNVSLLYGTARGTGMKFGAHIPADWYFGFPHDESTLRRLQLAVWLAYTYGGQIIYVESSLFKTNAHERNDWEDFYCRGVRGILRDFYRFVQLDNRVGRSEVPLALIYGNLESMFWMDDDRIPETLDMGGWDRLHWGMPGETSHRRLWTASEAWLPRVPLDEPRKESLTRMFTGTPYGPVDVVPPSNSLSTYKAVAFLGWNTMTEEIFANLLSYVREGGTVFICGCHLDTRVEAETSPSLIFGGRVSELIGANITGPGDELVAGIRACALEPTTARPIDEHFWLNELGAGKVYFGNFYDYPADFALIQKIKNLLGAIGEDVRQCGSLQIETSSPYVHYSVWEHEGKRKIYAVDAEWRKQQGSPAATLTIREGEHTTILQIEPGTLTVGETLSK